MNWTEINTVLIVQPENPDADSVAAALALEEILGDVGKQVIIYSYVHIPDYLHYIEGVDRIVEDFPNNFDVTIVVDTVTASLLEHTLSGSRLTSVQSKPSLVLDHHPADSDLPLPNAEYYHDSADAVSTGELVYRLSIENDWKINSTAATHIVESMLADTLGLTTEPVGATNVMVVAEMLKCGASMSEIDVRRRGYMKKSREIMTYKGVLLQRIEYLLEGKLAWIVIPWDEIQTYSPHYNPSMLALEELRNVQGIELSIALKTYPDGKITGKIRSNMPIASDLAGHFGGGGHPHAAGFKTMDWSLGEIKPEIIQTVTRLIKNQQP